MSAAVPPLQQEQCPTGHASAKPVSTFDTASGRHGTGPLYCSDCGSFVDTDSPADRPEPRGAAPAAGGPAGRAAEAYVRVGERGDLELVIPLANILDILASGGVDARD